MDKWFIPSILMVVLLMCVAMFIAESEEQRRWAAFRVAHDCKIVQEMDGDTLVSSVPTIGATGQFSVGTAITTTPPKVAWLCNDGITYWKRK